MQSLKSVDLSILKLTLFTLVPLSYSVMLL